MTEIHIVLVLVTLEQNLKHACKSTAHFPFASQLTIGRDAAIENTKDGMVYKCFGQFNLTDRCCLLKGRYHKTGKEVMEGRPLLHRLLGFKSRCKGCLKLIIKNYDAILSLKSEATIVLVMQTGKRADI